MDENPYQAPNSAEPAGRRSGIRLFLKFMAFARAIVLVVFALFFLINAMIFVGLIIKVARSL